MRAIKFRAWDKKRKGMIFGLNPFVVIHDENYAVMQYTGLKDKNGKHEIFEGDVLKVVSETVMENEILVVNWHEKHASFCLDKKGWMFSHYFGEAVNGSDVEVIGNIYENPELLK